MKRNLLISLFVLSVLSANQAQSQTISNPVEIKIELNDSKITLDQDKLNKLKIGQYYFVVIDKLNLGNYKIDIGNKDTMVTKPLSFPTFASLPIEALEKSVAGLSSVGNVVEAIPNDLEFTRELKESIKLNLLKSNTTFSAMTDVEYKSLEAEKRKPAKPSNKAQELLLINKDLLIEQLSKIQKQKREVDNLVIDIFRVFQNSQSINVALLGVTPTNESLTKTYIELRSKLDATSTEIENAYRSYRTSAAVKEIADAIDAETKFKELDKQIRNSYDEFEPAIAKIKESLNGENAAKLFGLLTQASNISKTPYKSLPLQLTEEQTTLEVKIVPRNDASGLQTYYTKLRFPLDDGKNFWGMSSGFYIGFQSNEAYSVKTNVTSSDTTYSIISENPGKVEIGFNTMLRRGWKLSNKSYWQVGIGPGVSISDKVRPRMMLGTGVSIGEKHALIIDVGVVSGYYDVKSQVYNESNAYSIVPTNIVVSQLQFGGYFSIGYLFLK